MELLTGIEKELGISHAQFLRVISIQKLLASSSPHIALKEMMKAADLPTYYNICDILEHNIGPRGDKTALLSEHGPHFPQVQNR